MAVEECSGGDHRAGLFPVSLATHTHTLWPCGGTTGRDGDNAPTSLSRINIIALFWKQRAPPDFSMLRKGGRRGGERREGERRERKEGKGGGRGGIERREGGEEEGRE